MKAPPDPVDARVLVGLVAHSPFRTWSIEIETPADAEPAALYAALVEAGWRDVTAIGLPPARKWDRRRRTWAPYLVRQRLFARDGETVFAPVWTEAERGRFIRGARVVLRRFGFTAVPLIKKLPHEK